MGLYGRQCGQALNYIEFSPYPCEYHILPHQHFEYNAQYQDQPQQQIALSNIIDPVTGAYSCPTSASHPPASTESNLIVARRREGSASKVIKSSVDKNKAAQKREKDMVLNRKVGKMKGPLRPDQRKSAGEIRKITACLRCKFLKITCDAGDPCGGCQAADTRIWQVPCTRIDIRDINYCHASEAYGGRRHSTSQHAQYFPTDESSLNSYFFGAQVVSEPLNQILRCIQSHPSPLGGETAALISPSPYSAPSLYCSAPYPSSGSGQLRRGDSPAEAQDGPP